MPRCAISKAQGPGAEAAESFNRNSIRGGTMKRTFGVVLALTVLLFTQTMTAQDAKAVIANASKAMGVDGLNSIHYYGVAQNGNLGQNNNANQPWPRANANDYVRAIDFTQPASRATWVNLAVPVTGGAAAQTPGQQ